MTDTTRTTVTLTNSSMIIIEKLVGVFGTTRAQVISNIVDRFLNNSNNLPLLYELEKRKKQLQKPEDNIIGQKINKLLIGANLIPLDSFLKHLDIDESFFYERNHIWSQKFNYYLEDNKIIKNE